MKAVLILAVMSFAAQSFSQTLSKKPNYAELNEKIIQPKCIQCHNDNFAERQVYLVTFEDVKSYAVAGKPEESVLFEVVSDKAMVRMPMGQKPLSPAEVNYIKAWIKAGMPEK